MNEVQIPIIGEVKDEKVIYFDEKRIFKNKVLSWLKENKIDVSSKKIRVYKYRGELELRIYGEPMEFPNTRKSHRKMDEPTDEYNSTYGIHSTKISSYTHISESDLKNEEEKLFILDTIRNTCG